MLMKKAKGSVIGAGCAALAVVGAAALGAGRGVETVVVPGGDVVVKLWQAADNRGEIRPYYAISFESGPFTEPRATSYELKLRHGSFDPLAFAPAPPIEGGFEAGEDTNLYIVQFVTQPLEVYREAITDLGGEVYFFLANHAHIVKMTPEVREEVGALPYVRWVGPYHPAYRLEEFMLHNVEVADELYPLQKYNIMVFKSAMEEKAAVAQRIEEMGGIVDRVHAGKYLLEATLTPEQLFEVVRWDEVLFVDRWSAGGPDMDIGREIGGANHIEAAGGYTGEGVRGEVIDVGFNLSHVDFASRPLIQHTVVNTDSHGASTSGICFGDGTGNPKARGLLPDGQGIVADWYLVGTGQARYDHTAELVEAPYYAVFQTASVGSDRTTEYSTISADTDAMLFDFDIVHCQSQSNAGDQMSRPQAWAKNIISGGAVYHYDTIKKTDDCWCGGASIGPASDGRIKPDLCFFYDDIFTVTCCGPTDYTSSFGGTSGATPMICGHVGLFFEMWADGAFNNPVDPSGTVFDNRCHMTTAKAMMINTADSYPFPGAGDDLERVHQGWGMPDLERMYDLRFRMFIVDEADLVTNMGSVMYQVTVDAGEPELRATLVYADPPGVPGSSQHRINDLSLKVTTPSGVVYWGNNGLLEGNWSAPGGEANEVDTVENVFVQDPEPGLWTVEVFGHEVNQDGHVETPQLDADYALVVSGVEEILPALIFKLLSGWPDMVLPGTPVDVEVQVLDGEESVVPGTELLFYRMDAADDFTPIPMAPQGDGKYVATVPGAMCDETPQFYFSVEGDGGTLLTSPPSAPGAFYAIEKIGEILVDWSDDFEEDLGWSVEDDPPDLPAGTWERGVPVGGGDRGDPPTDADGSGQCYVTENKDGDYDIDDGSTMLFSPILDASDPNAVISYYRWYSNTWGADPKNDIFVVDVSDDGGATWENLETVGPSGAEVSGGWYHKEFLVADIAGITNTDQFRIRFTASDLQAGSVVEAGVDGVAISRFHCEDVHVPGDVTGDGLVDVLDLLEVLGAWGECPDPPAECPADLTGDGVVDVLDLLQVLANWT